MLVKLLSVIALAAAPVPASPQTNPHWQGATAPVENQVVTATEINPFLHPEIVRVDCDESRGSAVRIGPRLLLSVAHVTDNEGCLIGGLPFKILGQKGDFSVLSMEVDSAHWLGIDCGGFIKGRKYTAIGYARGLPFLTSVDVVAMGETLWGYQRLWGVFTVIPGMSGSAFLDSETGKIVGMVNVYEARRGDSGGVALKDTNLCPNT